MSDLPGMPASKDMPKRALLMELVRCETFRAKISPETCRVRKEMAANPDPQHYINGASFSFMQCLDCKPEGKKRVEVEVMGEGKRKYTMSEAAMKARKETAIKAGAKRSRKISKEGYILPSKAVPICSECGDCGPDIEEPVQAKAWEETGTKRPGDELKVCLDFFEHPKMFEELMTLAKNEMRAPETQILYLLKNGNFDALKH